MNPPAGGGVVIEVGEGGNVMRLGLAARALMVTALVCGAASVADAQGPADFYKGKTVDLMIGYSVGGGYDV